MVWQAIVILSGKRLCVGNTYKECSDIAVTLMPWGDSGGEVAPYYFTTITKDELINELEIVETDSVLD